MVSSSIQCLGKQRFTAKDTFHFTSQSPSTFTGSIKCGGSGVAPYVPTNDSPNFGEPPTNIKIISISAMNAYANQSHEEIRLKDYEQENKNAFAESSSDFSASTDWLDAARNGFASAAHGIDTGLGAKLIGGSAVLCFPAFIPCVHESGGTGTHEGPSIKSVADCNGWTILPCEDADKDESIIALAEFAVEQQNAFNKNSKLSLLEVLAACLEAVHCGRYHILLEAKDATASDIPFKFLAVVLQHRTARQTLTLLENWQPN